ncbi:DUF1440 domain-containing protein [Deinococcus peraridilitoris]|uniref:Putative periplasmic/secreted protein n=1 Tax=Deinococcus peraridilitoris (strain DSM 19664 / LMG 22246 / CIP 109416 / KR-200) TaxID=937777 RepID=K9ZX75_DEIPD|nr:DUF1440 domain-containing protein [Deinococcus peraridilitoris]AFZ66253.1 putative periplasmic/secreted protein [Deinococcus peraridilitoris DSM 19664]
MNSSAVNVLNEAIKGTVAGAAGVWMMDRIGWYMYLREDERALQQELEARPNGMDPAHNIANRVANALGKQLVPPQPNPWGVTAHFALGILPAALYGVLRHRFRELSKAQGFLYGLSLFAMNDELVNPLLKLSGGPRAYPWQAHARGLVEHIVLGMVTDAVLRVMDRELHPPRPQDLTQTVGARSAARS